MTALQTRVVIGRHQNGPARSTVETGDTHRWPTHCGEGKKWRTTHRAQTNYAWCSENKIAELEQQIANFRVKRQQIAKEAESVWAWLSEKEAYHYEKFPVTEKMKEGDELDPASQASSFFLQTLGQLHAGL